MKAVYVVAVDLPEIGQCLWETGIALRVTASSREDVTFEGPIRIFVHDAADRLMRAIEIEEETDGRRS